MLYNTVTHHTLLLVGIKLCQIIVLTLSKKYGHVTRFVFV